MSVHTSSIVNTVHHPGSEVALLRPNFQNLRARSLQSFQALDSEITTEGVSWCQACKRRDVIDARLNPG